MNQKFIKNAAIIVLAVLLLGGGYFYFSKKIDQTSSWKTYINNQYSFEFKYPSEWKDAERDISIQNYFTKLPNIGVLSLELVNNPKSLGEISKDEIAQNNCPGDKIIKKDDKGVLYVLYCSASSENYVYLTNIANGNKLKFSYHDNFEDSWSEGQKLDVFNKILSTFKFTN